MAKRTPETELSFKIDAFTPETLPLDVFAEYVTELVHILGEPKDINFVRLGRGSAKFIQKVKQHAIPSVRERIESVQHRKGPDEALSAYARVNSLLVRDNAVGTLSLGGAKLLDFPGRKEKPEPPIGPVTQPDFLDGQLIRVGGKDATVPVHLREEDGTIHYCTANMAMAMQLAPYLYRQSLRVHGTGHWYRHDDGRWVLELFRIDSFDTLEDKPLFECVFRRCESNIPTM